VTIPKPSEVIHHSMYSYLATTASRTTGTQNMHAHQNWDLELRVINNGVYQWKPDAERHRETSPDLWADTAQCKH
jgi:hypothetical protein